MFSNEEEKSLSLLYGQGKNDYEVAQLLHTGRDRLRLWRNEHKILSRTNKKGLSPELCSSILRQRDSGQSFEEIAAQYGVHRTSITKLLSRCGHSYSIRNRAVPSWVSGYVLTERQVSGLVGDVFGDGHISRTSKRGAYYSCSHAIEQEEFVLFKSLLFAPLSNRIYYGSSSDGSYVSLTTWSCPGLVSYHDRFYPNGGGDKALPLELIQFLDARALALWYMGDGCRHRDEARITVGVSVDLEPVLAVLNRRYDNLFRARRYALQWTIFMNDQRRFFELVGPFMIPCMLYKVPDRYREFCTGSFPDLIELKKRIDLERQGTVPFRVLL